MNFLRTYRIEILIFVVSLGVHLASFAVAVNVAGGDVLSVVRADDGFYELAANVRAGNGFSWSTEAPYAPNPLRTPGFSYTLALLLGLGVTGAALVQLVFASAIPLFGMVIARMITNSKAIGVIAGIVLALDPTLAILSFQFYSDTLFLLLFLPWLILTLRYFERWDAVTLVASAILMGAAILVRPVVQYLPFLIMLGILWHFRREWRRAVMHSGVYLIVICAILAPWVMRNQEVFGTPGLSAQSSFILYTNLAPAVLSVATGVDFLEERAAFLTEAEYKGDAITLANGGEYTKRALEVVLAHPLPTAWVVGKSLFTFFTNDGFYAFLARIGYEPNNFLPFLIVMRLVWIAVTLAAFVGALVYVRRERSLRTILVLFLVAYFALTSAATAFGTNPRYRLPVDPIIIALAAIGTSAALSYRNRTLPEGR